MKVPPFFQEKSPFFEKIPYVFRPWIAALISGFLGLAILIVYSKSHEGATEYKLAQEAFAKWKDSMQDDGLLIHLKKMLSKQTVIQKKIGPDIVQLLMAHGQIEKGLDLALPLIIQMKEEAPFHGVFAEASLLIEQSKFQEALEKSVRLKETMHQVSQEKGLWQTSVVYAYNLLRIACLHQTLHNIHGEKAALDDLELFLKTHEQEQGAAGIQQIFREQGVNLFQYIADRKKQL